MRAIPDGPFEPLVLGTLVLLVAGALGASAWGAELKPISFPDVGARQVTVTWDGPAGKGAALFSVNVR